MSLAHTGRRNRMNATQECVKLFLLTSRAPRLSFPQLLVSGLLCRLPSFRFPLSGRYPFSREISNARGASANFSSGMAGHSKWSKVKHIKGPLDVKRGQAFSKLVKEITVAARMGGGDLSGNPRLRSVVETARGQNMPKENIERAIKKGTGELEGVNYEEAVYEAYAPGGVAMIVEAATDNKNRTAADFRLIFGKNHGSLAATGSVSYMFHKKGQITVPALAGGRGSHPGVRA